MFSLFFCHMHVHFLFTCWCILLLTSSPMSMAATLKAPELDGAVGWLNAEKPIKLSDLRGKIVLLDFWTYCCINCMHIIPDLKKLEAKYPNELVVLGIHSAKFNNEKESNNIRQAILRYEIEHPVANDADFKIWRSFDVHAWPTRVLIDVDGSIVESISGEGQYDLFDQTIAALIKKAKKAGKLNDRSLHFTLEKEKASPHTLSFPGKVIADEKNGHLFIADSNHNRIVVTGFDGKLVAMIGSGKQGHDDGGYRQASFHHPQGMAWKEPYLYVADTKNHLIRRIDTLSKKVETIAGTSHQAMEKFGTGKATETDLSSPWDLALVGDYLYIAMAGNHQIWVLNLKTQGIGPAMGSGREARIDGPPHSAAFAQPSGLTTDGKTLWVADSEVSAIRAIRLMDGITQTIIGEDLFEFGDVDGGKDIARLQHPLGVLFYDGKLYVADTYNHKIKIVDPVAHTSKTFVGNGKTSELCEPGGLTIANGKLYVADTNHHRILVVDIESRSFQPLKVEAPLPDSAEAKSATVCEGDICKPK